MWRNWQTRKIQVLMVERSCRFKSCHPHQMKKRTGISGSFFSFAASRTGATCTSMAAPYRALHALADMQYAPIKCLLRVRCKASPVIRTKKPSRDFWSRLVFFCSEPDRRNLHEHGIHRAVHCTLTRIRNTRKSNGCRAFAVRQVLSSAPNRNNTNQEDDSRFVLFFARDYFGAIVRLDQHL